MNALFATLRFYLLPFLLVGWYSVEAMAGEPPSAPILRINPGEHTASIRRIASDEAGRWLVTASDDKTARVWSAADGRLLATLRAPIGAGNEGKLNAVAMSPDGKMIALGGYTGWDYDGSASIYLYDRASGRLLRRFSGLPNVVYDLAFSPDGRALAASLGSDKGVRLVDAADGRLLGEDRDYGALSLSVDFRADGRRLVSTSYDGQVRLYKFDQKGLRLIAKQAAPGGTQPTSARFSPDGKRIAVGFNETTAVNLLDADTLGLLEAPDTTDVVGGNLSSVAWSRDGAWLYAAGMAQRAFKHNDQRQLQFIRRWSVNDNQAGKPEDWAVAGSTIMHLVPLPGQNGSASNGSASNVSASLAFVSQEPSWGVVNGEGRRVLFHDSSVADFRDNHAGFSLSADAAQVRFGYALFGKSPTVFDSQTRAFLSEDSSGLTPPRQSVRGLEVSNWKETYAPKLNGQPIKLADYEWSTSLALRPDDSGFILGTQWYLRAIDRAGNQTWQIPAPDSTWGVNISRDGRWVVAAYGDGTIRWHRADDGVEQMAFYAHPDKKRWVLWSPSGYFDASPGAEDLIGWHVNNGNASAADYFPASRFRERFYRPDVLANVLNAGGEDEALRLANADLGGKRVAQASVLQTLPPVTRIIAPVEGERFSQARQTFRYTVRTVADAPVTGVKVLVDGRPISLDRGLKPKAVAGEQTFTLEVSLPERDVTVSLIAENKHGASVESSIRLAWAGSKAQAFVAKPKLYVLAVGVSDYQDKSLKLNYPAKDARDFAAALQNQKNLYRDVAVKVLADATAEQVLDGLDWLRAEVTAKDVGVLFLAGHGVNDADGDYYFLPRDANPDRLRRTAVPYFEVKKTLSSLPGKTLAFIDTCHSGNVMGENKSVRRGVADINQIVNDLTAAENGVVVFASSTGRQFSLENSDWKNGAFTKALVEGLGGKADYTHDGAISINELDTWLADRVKQLTGNQQTPTTTKPNTVPDFPVAVVR